ncbi:MAG: HEAT repeat domain-containing protein [Candidatus Thorarchaeota archaeon]
MASESIEKLVSRRLYPQLEERATEYIESGDWKKFLRNVRRTSSKGKARDALVNLLKLEAVGGTDSDILKEFASLQGDTLTKIRANATERSMEILTEQIENRHTYFLDIEAMTMSPYVFLVKDVIEARKREIAQLEGTPSRLDILGTFYGFSILMIEGSKTAAPQTNQWGYRYWRRSTWLDEKITETAANAVKQLTGELAESVDMDKTYKTLGSSRIFKSKCTKTTADILANAVRLAFYKVPGNRSRAARDLGKTEDLRALPFLHQRLTVEGSMRVRMAIVEALGKIGHESSIAILKERAKLTGRRFVTKEAEAATLAIGGIYSRQCGETLLEILRVGGNPVKAAAIKALSTQEQTGLVEIIAPYLIDKSRPVVRASVIALMDLGRKGRAAIKKNAPTIIKRIGSDRPSKVAFSKMMSIGGVGMTTSVHQYFAKRVKQLESEIKNWQRRTRTGSYTWYWQRRERKARSRLTDLLRMANEYLKPPFDVELVKALRSLTKSKEDPTIMTLARRLLLHVHTVHSEEVVETKSDERKSFIQTFLDSYR